MKIYNLKTIKMRLFAWFMAVVITVTGIPFPAYADIDDPSIEYSDTLDGWKVQCSWSTLTNDYVWNAEGESKRQPKLITTYRIEEASKQYDIGSLVFMIPGIGNIDREGILKAVGAGENNQSSDWAYEWDSVNDIYTIKNNFVIQAGDSLSGGFELMWDLDAYDCVNGFTRTESPTFSVNEDSIYLEPVSFTFTSQHDLNRVTMTYEPLEALEWEASDEDYVWYDLETDFDTLAKARGIYKSTYFVEVILPVKMAPEDVIVDGRPLVQNGDAWGFYPFKERYGDLIFDNLDRGYYVQNRIGFLKSKLKDETVYLYGHLDRLFYDDTEWVSSADLSDPNYEEIVDVELSITVTDYGFTYDSYGYRVYKNTTGGYEDYRTHNAPEEFTKRLISTNIYNGKVVEFGIQGVANRNYASAFSLRRMSAEPDEMMMFSTSPASASPSNASPSNASELDETLLDTFDFDEDIEETYDEAASIYERETSLPEGVEDWNDIYWKKNGYLDDVQAEEAEEEGEEGFSLWNAIKEVFASIMRPSEKASAFLLTAYAATPSEAEKSPEPELATPNNPEKDESSELDDPEGNEDFDVASPYNAEKATLWTLERLNADCYDMIVGDDYLAIMLRNGEFRNLTDEEYSITHVEVPADDYEYEYTVYVADSQDTPFDEYEVLGEGNTKRSKTFLVDQDCKAVYVRIKDIEGSYKKTVWVGVRFHLDWSTQMKEELRPYHDGRIVNFSYMRALVNDEEDCIVDDSNYSGEYAKMLSQRDLTLYDQYLARDFSHVWLREPSTYLEVETSIDNFSGSPKNGLYATVTTNAQISADSADNLTSFSIYSKVPKGTTAVLSNDSIHLVGHGIDINGVDVTDFSAYTTYSERVIGEDTYIVANINVTDLPLNILNETEVTLTYQIYLPYAEILENGTSYTTDSYLFINDDGHENIIATEKVEDTSDLDEDGNKKEYASYDKYTGEITDVAIEWQEYVSKYVKSLYSGGNVTNTVVKLYDENTALDQQKGAQYSYRLDFGVGSDYAKEIVFYDSIENLSSDWRGTLVSVNTDYLESLGIKTTVYYSTNPDQEFDITKDGWTSDTPSDLSSVRSIAVRLDTSNLEDGCLKANQVVYLELLMRATSDRSAIGTIASNQATVKYKGYDLQGGSEKDYELTTSPTNVTLLDSVGTIILQSVDGDNQIGVDPEGNPKYAPLTGGTYMVYDKDGNPIFDEPVGPDALARIIEENVEYSDYSWEQITPPEGYIPIEGKRPFTLTETTRVIIIENHRIFGTVTLEKHDADHSEYSFISGATYELYKIDGTRVHTDASYTWGESDANEFFVTGADGTFTIKNLPWGSYYFVETDAPEGYTLSEENLTFSVNQKNLVLTVKGFDNEKTTDVRLTLRDQADLTPLKDGYYDLYREQVNGDGETEWVLLKENLKTNSVGEIFIEDLLFGNYKFVETKTPKGYMNPGDPPEFVIDASTVGTVVEVEHVNLRKEGSARLLKKDSEGQPLSGAKYSLYKKGNSTPVAEGLVTDIEGLTPVASNLSWGNYYFVEVEAPKGYVLDSTPKEFVVDAETAEITQRISAHNNRILGNVKLIKMSEGSDDVYLPGAVYALYTLDGTLVRDYIYTGKDGSALIEGLDWGSYYLLETEAPHGYGLSDKKVRFSINQDSCTALQEVICYDSLLSGEIVIEKSVDRIYEAYGESPVFVFEVVGTDLDGNEHKYIRQITVSGSNLYGKAVIQNVPFGSYTIREIQNNRYELAEVYPLTRAVDVKADLTVEVTLNSVFMQVGVGFVNSIRNYSMLSDMRGVTNIITAGRKLTGISVEYLGEEEIQSDVDSTYTFVADDMEITAIYDDGTSAVIDFSQVTLDPAFVKGTPNASGAGQTVTVSYTEGGITRTDTFSVVIKLQPYIETYTLTLDATEGEFSDKATKKQIAVTNVDETYISALAEYEEPTHREKLFGGWYSDSACTTGNEVDLSSTRALDIKADITIYAKWIEAKAIFNTGSTINTQMQTLAGSLSNIYRIAESDTAPQSDAGYTFVDVSARGSNTALYMWYSDNTIYWWSKDKNPQLNEDASKMFQNCTDLIDISTLSSWDVSNTTSLSRMFERCSALTNIAITALDSWNVSNATSLSYMFSACSSLIDVSALESWNVSNATNLSYMFSTCSSLNDISALGSWNISKVTNLSYMFSTCSSLNDISALESWNVSNVENFSYMFYKCSLLESDDLYALSGWQLTKAKNLNGMFSNLTKITSIDALKNWDISNVTSLGTDNGYHDGGIFSNCKNLVDISALENWNTSKVTGMAYVFYECYALADFSPLATWDVSKVTSIERMFSLCKGITNVAFATNWNTSKVTNMEYTFFASSISDISGLANWNTSSVVNMLGTFHTCSGITNLDALANWDTSNVTNMQGLFSSCHFLVDATGISEWHTVNVTNIMDLFWNCTRLKYIDLSGWDVSKASVDEDTFYSCSSVINPAYARTEADAEKLNSVLDVSFTWNFTVKERTQVPYLESPALFTPKIPDTVSNVVFTDVTVPDGVEAIDVSHYSDESVVAWTVDDTFYVSSQIAGQPVIANKNSSKMFYQKSNLVEIDALMLDVSKVTNMSYMFYKCQVLSSIDVSGWNTANVTDMNHMFNYCQVLNSIDVSGWNTSNVTDMNYMFGNCKALNSLNVSGWNTSKVLNMSYLFYTCSALVEIRMNQWDMSAVNNKSSMLSSTPGSGRTCYIYCSEETENALKSGTGYNSSRIVFQRPN